MIEYPKIDNLFKRDEQTKQFKMWEWRRPEFKLLKDLDWIATEKIDGTNIRILLNSYEGNDFVIRGRTDSAMIPSELRDNIIKMVTQRRSLFTEVFGNKPVCLYGEGYGKKIQSGFKYHTNTQRFILFDICVGNVWIDYDNIEGIAEKLDMDIVPLICKKPLLDIIEIVNDGLESTFGNFYAEGLVAKPVINLFNNRYNRIITKIKHIDYFGVEL